MNISTLYGGGGLESNPMIHVQDLDDVSIDGGWASPSQAVNLDLKYIVYNSIQGATLTADGNTSGNRGFVASGSIINNPSNGVHNNLCWVNLPTGKYFAEMYTEAAYQTANLATIAYLYNKSDSEIIHHSKTQWRSHPANGATSDSVVFEIDSPKQITYQYQTYTSLTAQVDNLGHRTNADPIAGTKSVLHDLKIYKLS